MEKELREIIGWNCGGTYEAKVEAVKQILVLFNVSGSLEKDAIMHYDLLIKRDLPNTFKTLRDHGTHCDFCDKINDIRTEAILNYR
jgi:hypothetical protein